MIIFFDKCQRKCTELRIMYGFEKYNDIEHHRKFKKTFIIDGKCYFGYSFDVTQEVENETSHKVWYFKVERRMYASDDAWLEYIRYTMPSYRLYSLNDFPDIEEIEPHRYSVFHITESILYEDVVTNKGFVRGFLTLSEDEYIPTKSSGLGVKSSRYTS